MDDTYETLRRIVRQYNSLSDSKRKMLERNMPRLRNELQDGAVLVCIMETREKMEAGRA